MLISNRLSSHVLRLCIITCVPFIIHVISFMNQLWHHSNAYISFMHYSDRAVGERTHRARRSRWNRARCGVCCWPGRKPKQATKHDPLYLFKLMQFSYLIWVLLGYIYYVMYCILVPTFIYLPSLFCYIHLLATCS